MEILAVKYCKDKISNENCSVKIFESEDTDSYLNAPLDENNTEYKEVLAWVAEGNTIEPADE